MNDITAKDGSVTIQAAPAVARMGNAVEVTPSQLVGTIIRHMKGVLAAAEELRALLEKNEKS